MSSPSGVDPRVRMANDIAAQFAHLPHDAAVAAVAAHLRTFWAPAMRAQLLAAADSVPLDRAGPLDPVAADAARSLH